MKKKIRTPEKIGGLIESFLSVHGYLGGIREQQALIEWNKIVGEQVALHTECQSVEDGILYVKTSSAAWRQELSFMKPSLIQKIREHTKSSTLRDIVFI